MSTVTPEQQAYQDAHWHEDRRPRVIAVAIFLIVFTTLVVMARVGARLARRMSIWWDDGFAVISLVFTILTCVINIICTNYGLGLHIWRANPQDGYKILQAGFYLSINYAISQWFLKMTLLFTFIRIFSLRMPWFRYAVYFCFFYITAWALSLIIAALTQCKPISYFWQRYNLSRNPPAQGEYYINSNALVISSSALNTAADFALLLLPLTLIWRLQMSSSKKIAVGAIFAMGTFACVAGVLRLVSTCTTIAVNTDSTWDTATIYQWTAVESAVQLWCACLPVAAPLFNLGFERVKSMASNFSQRRMLSGEGSGSKLSDPGAGSVQRSPKLDLRNEGNSETTTSVTSQKSGKDQEFEMNDMGSGIRRTHEVTVYHEGA